MRQEHMIRATIAVTLLFMSLLGLPATAAGHDCDLSRNNDL